jgi:hypothetical protein
MESFTAVLSEAQKEKVMESFNGKEGAHFLGAPTIISKQDQSCKVEVAHEFRYPTEFTQTSESPGVWAPSKFMTKNIGISLEASGHVEGSNDIYLKLRSEGSNYLASLYEKDGAKWVSRNGVTPRGGFGRPIFSNGMAECNVDLMPHYTVLTGAVMIDRPGGIFDLIKSGKAAMDAHGDKVRTERLLLLTFITPELVTSKEMASAGIHNGEEASTPAGIKNPSLPFGKAVKDKPGFVTSPYAPDDGEIDVRGFPKNSEVRDPYSENMFLVP